MSKKTVPFKMPVKAPDPAEVWVQKREGALATDRETPVVTALPEPESEPMKRFTIDVPESLHKRIKAQCALRGDKMADVIRAMLDREFPSQA
jgi:hypothetical protein